MPFINHFSTYSETLAFLRAAGDAGTPSGRDVIARLNAVAIDDPLFGPTTYRVDGRAVLDMFLFGVKAPEASSGPFDLYDLVAIIPAGQAFRPVADGGCPLVADGH